MAAMAGRVLVLLAVAQCAAGFSLGRGRAAAVLRAPARATTPRPGVVCARRGLAGALRALTEAAAAPGGEPPARLARRDALCAAVLLGWGLSVSVTQADDGALAASKLYSLPTSYGCKVSGRAHARWMARAGAREARGLPVSPSPCLQ